MLLIKEEGKTMWRCTQCETLNDDQEKLCIICGNPQPKHEEMQLQQRALHSSQSPSQTGGSVDIDYGSEPCDDWLGEEYGDPYAERSRGPEKRVRKYRFLWGLTVLGILSACILAVVVFFPYVQGYFPEGVSRVYQKVMHIQVEKSDGQTEDVTEEDIFHTEKQTAVPTLKPTATATVRPTATPTAIPTASPTVVPTATPTLAPITHIVGKRDSYIYARADSDTLVIGELKQGEYIQYEGASVTVDNGCRWYKVEHNDKYGWVSSQWTELARADEVPTNRTFDYSCLIANNDCGNFFYWDDYYGEFELYDGMDAEGNLEDEEVERSIYTLGDVNMRALPGLGEEILATIKKDTIVTYLKRCSTDERGVIWYLVLYDGLEGWVSSKFAILG